MGKFSLVQPKGREGGEERVIYLDTGKKKEGLTVSDGEARPLPAVPIEMLGVGEASDSCVQMRL